MYLFCSHENDQSGERPRDPRHIYAKSAMPEVCPVLALGNYWAYFQFDPNNDQLFPDSNQYEWFRKQLQALLSRPDILQEPKKTRSTLVEDCGQCVAEAAAAIK